jgi:hypothetical protein
MQTIQAIAQLLLGKKIALEFNTVLIEFYETNNIKEFYHLKHIKKYTQHLSHDEWDDEEELLAAEILYTFAKENKITEFIDWSGEEYDNQLQMIISNQLKAKGIVNFKWDFLDVFEETLNWTELEKGDYIFKKLIEVDKHLQEINYKIIFLTLSWAGYIPFIVTDEEFEVAKTFARDKRGDNDISISSIEDV